MVGKPSFESDVQVIPSIHRDGEDINVRSVYLAVAIRGH